jgi:hypothetical protein
VKDVVGHRRKALAGEPTNDRGSWVAARFPNQESRDGFLRAVAAAGESAWEAEAITAEDRGARVRWSSGHFLGLNDMAYTHGGRINVTITRRSAL